MSEKVRGVLEPISAVGRNPGQMAVNVMQYFTFSEINCSVICRCREDLHQNPVSTLQFPHIRADRHKTILLEAVNVQVLPVVPPPVFPLVIGQVNVQFALIPIPAQRVAVQNAVDEGAAHVRSLIAAWLRIAVTTLRPTDYMPG